MKRTYDDETYDLVPRRKPRVTTDESGIEYVEHIPRRVRVVTQDESGIEYEHWEMR